MHRGQPSLQRGLRMFTTTPMLFTHFTQLVLRQVIQSPRNHSGIFGGGAYLGRVGPEARVVEWITTGSLAAQRRSPNQSEDAPPPQRCPVEQIRGYAPPSTSFLCFGPPGHLCYWESNPKTRTPVLTPKPGRDADLGKFLGPEGPPHHPSFSHPLVYAHSTLPFSTFDFANAPTLRFHQYPGNALDPSNLVGSSD